MTKTEPRSAGSGGGREKPHPTPTELLVLADDPTKLRSDAMFAWQMLSAICESDECTRDRMSARDAAARVLAAIDGTLATTLSAREDGWQPIEIPQPQKEVYIAGDHGPQWREALEDYYDAEQMQAASDDSRRYAWLRQHFLFANDSMQELWFSGEISSEDAAELDRSIDSCIAAPKAPTAGEGK